MEIDKEKIARENILRKSGEVNGVKILGWDFNNGNDLNKVVESFGSVGMQASKLSKAIKIVNKMIEENSFIYLGYTSNQVSSGNREVIRWLVEHKKVNVLVTTAGGIEEDIIKCLGDFILGDFRESGKKLREDGINRIGNIYAPNNRYCDFEDFFNPILEELWEEQEKSGEIITASKLIWKLGEKINDERSICYWAWKNKIKIYCPAITDGALGDNVYFFKYKRPEFKIDVSEDIKEINDSTIGKKKTGIIILGAGVVKHHILNANMFRNGADYAVYINTAQEYDGSDAGALPEEAISWGKLLPDCERVKVYGDTTILFPLLVARSFAR
jgi:deoxyhypusine synthase